MRLYTSKFKKNSLLVLFFTFALLFGKQAYCQEPAKAEVPVRQESVTVIKNDKVGKVLERYKLCPGDVLSLSIYDELDLTQPSIIIRPDGYATINPIGEVYIEGMDIKDLTKLLYEKFSDYLVDPKISVNVTDFSPASVYIFGAVEKPGTYQQAIQISKNYYADSKNPTVKTDLSLINVISNAGGIASDADLSNISVTGLENKVKKIDLWKFIKENDVTQNVKLQAGDVIYIPKLEGGIIADEDFRTLTRMSLFPATYPVRVIGEVKMQGTIELSGTSPYLNTAISSAQGYTLDANRTVVLVHRKAGDEKLAKIYVSPFKQDFVLRPNDLVEVRKREFMKFVFGMDYLARILSPFNMIPAVGNGWADLVAPRRRYYIN